MLVIARRLFTPETPETVVLTVPPSSEPTTIQVRVTRTGQWRAWLGIEAPRQVVIARNEAKREDRE